MEKPCFPLPATGCSTSKAKCLSSRHQALEAVTIWLKKSTGLQRVRKKQSRCSRAKTSKRKPGSARFPASSFPYSQKSVPPSPHAIKPRFISSFLCRSTAPNCQTSNTNLSYKPVPHRRSLPLSSTGSFHHWRFLFLAHTSR